MNDVPLDFGSLPILDPDRVEYHKAVRSFQAHKVDDATRRRRIWFWIAVGGSLIAVAQTITIATLLPLKRVEPLFMLVREDGTVDSGVSLADLGVDMAQKVIRASIWRYVEERESYTFADARHRYDLVSVMSAEDVQHDYQMWFSRAKDAPQQSLGKNGQISVQEISIIFVREGVAEVRFAKSKQRYGGKEEKTTATATVQFELLNNAPASLVLDDPAALRIVRYSVEENSAS